MRSSPTRRRPDPNEDRASPPPRWAARAALALAGVVVVGLWQARAALGNGRQHPRIRPGEGLSNHILALKEALASAPSKHAARIDAHHGRVSSVAVSADGRTALS